jgi:hypothetical protein
MNFISTTSTDLQTFLVYSQQNGISLTLKFRSKVKFENIFKFLGYDFLYHVNTFIALKLIVKKLLSIEIVIFHICTCKPYLEKYRSQEIAWNKLEKGLLFVYFWHLLFWRRFLKIKLFFGFSLPVQKLFGIAEL